MVCLKRKIIFTHPQKCGGTSFESFLGFENTSRHSFLYKHAGLNDHIKLIESLDLNPTEFIKISIIRNPWERIFSWYNHLKERALLAKMNNDKIGDQKKAALELDFNEFVVHMNLERKVFHKFHRNFSYFMFGKSGSFEIDFVIRYENYTKDFLNCAHHLGYRNITLESIPHINKGGNDSANYRAEYNQKSRDIVARIYSKDIEFFSYTF